jgi:hypothetical protein
MSNKLKLSCSETMQIIKYRKVSKCAKTFLDRKTIQKIDDEKNLMHFSTQVVVNIKFKIRFLFYFDWYPHVQHFLILENDLDFARVIWYILKENAKSNARKWNIFLETQKMKMEFNEFLIYLISRNPDFQKYFISQKLAQKINCQNCQFMNKTSISISNEYSFCKNLSIIQNRYDKTQYCINSDIVRIMKNRKKNNDKNITKNF